LNSILPYPVKRSKGYAEYVFDQPGRNSLNLINEYPKTLVLSSNPVENALAEVLGKHIDADLKSLESSEDSISVSDYELVLIVGDSISSVIERQLKKDKISVYRFKGVEEASAEIASLFWIDNKDYVYADIFDYDSILKAKEEAIKKDLPLLFTAGDVKSEEVKELSSSKKTFNKGSSGAKKEIGQDNSMLIGFILIFIIVVLGLSVYFILKKK
jgi:hypothetical protein